MKVCGVCIKSPRSTLENCGQSCFEAQVLLLFKCDVDTLYLIENNMNQEIFGQICALVSLLSFHNRTCVCEDLSCVCFWLNFKGKGIM